MNRYILNRYENEIKCNYILEPDANCTWRKKKKRKENGNVLHPVKKISDSHVKTSRCSRLTSILVRSKRLVSPRKGERETRNTNDLPLFASFFFDYRVLFYDSSFYDKWSDIGRQNSRARRRNDATKPPAPGASDSIEREKREKVRELTNVHNQHVARSV